MADIEKLIACLKHCAGDGDCLQCDRWTLNIEYKCVDDLLLSAAIALEEKQATSNNGKQWIPVTERLPDMELAEVKKEDMDLFPCLVSKNVTNPKRKKLVTKAWYDGIGFTDIDCFDITNEITHWMPLPDTPKEE